MAADIFPQPAHELPLGSNMACSSAFPWLAAQLPYVLATEGSCDFCADRKAMFHLRQRSNHIGFKSKKESCVLTCRSSIQQHALDLTSEMKRMLLACGCIGETRLCKRAQTSPSTSRSWLMRCQQTRPSKHKIRSVCCVMSPK